MRTVILLAFALGCSKGADTDLDAPDSLALLGDGTHDLGSVRFDVMLTEDDGLKVPRDLDFNPDRPTELWVVNKRDDSVVIAFDTDDPEAMTSEKRIDPYALHFMETPSSIAFGAPGTFGTCQESRNTYNGQASPNDFMGPSLWSSDLDVFATSNPEAIEYLSDLFGSYTDLGSHLDMLHETPLCMGMAWETENRYWVFDGKHGAISMADFREDHGVGYDDHQDGIVERYVQGSVERVKGVPSHLAFDHDTDWLYVASTSTGQLTRLDTTSGEDGKKLASTERYDRHVRIDDAVYEVVVDDELLVHPSGLALHDGLLWTADNDTGIISAWTLDGELVDYLETGMPAGALMGITFDQDGQLWAVNAEDHMVFRIAPK